MTVSTIQMEVKKDGFRQMQDGTVKISLTVHPNDDIIQFVKAPMGQRFMAVLAEVGDDDQPVKKEKTPGEKAVQRAALLCKEGGFQAWINRDRFQVPATEVGAKMWLCERCGIESRSELATNDEAREQFERICTDYQYRDYQGE